MPDRIFLSIHNSHYPSLCHSLTHDLKHTCFKRVSFMPGVKEWGGSQLLPTLHRLLVWGLSSRIRTQMGSSRINAFCFSFLKNVFSVIHCVAKKVSTQPPTTISTIVVEFQQFLVKIFLSKYAIERWFTIPPHLFIVRTLPWETLRPWKWQAQQ